MKQFDLSLYLVLDRELCGSFGMVETAIAAVRGKRLRMMPVLLIS